MTYVKYSKYPVNVLHVQTCWTIPVTQIYHTLNNPTTIMFLIAHAGLCRSLSTTGMSLILEIK